MKTPEKPPIRSGFCNRSNPPSSHAHCRKGDCPCDCHTVTVPAAAVDAAAQALAVNNLDFGDLPDAAVYKRLATAALTAALPHLGGAA